VILAGDFIYAPRRYCTRRCFVLRRRRARGAIDKQKTQRSRYRQTRFARVRCFLHGDAHVKRLSGKEAVRAEEEGNQVMRWKRQYIRRQAVIIVGDDKGRGQAWEKRNLRKTLQVSSAKKSSTCAWHKRITQFEGSITCRRC